MENVEYPCSLIVRLLFVNKPELDAAKILKCAEKYINKVTHFGGTEESLFFAFPEHVTELKEGMAPSSCLLTFTDSRDKGIQLPDSALNQNWHWAEAGDEAAKCKYELLLSDMMMLPLERDTRVELFSNFAVAVIEALRPDVVYSVPAQKLVKPATLLEYWSSENRPYLYLLLNVRLFNVSNGGANEMLMDTIGLNPIGLPDFQIRFAGKNPNAIAGMLDGLSYYLYKHGEVIQDGNTVAGTEEGSRWKCQRQMSIVEPKRLVINIDPQ